MENSLVTYGFNKDREVIEHLSGSMISVVWLFVLFVQYVALGPREKGVISYLNQNLTS